ncbi:hypothetical protein RKE25_20445 [Dyella sp. BiH032]|uniref:hypothetical protein n=1 Tax=Dyella sp. BiH032 TaxID=3075430 RepID=UPI00289354DC|nr:hypothetical protein [Dyella sp. BiH032]WNL45751.1 hypothetical protein RKE25_20445 [Dyella sp. BiH032]
MKRKHVSWGLWAVGATLIALSCIGTVDRQFGWMGFFAGLAGSVRRPGPADLEENAWKRVDEE